MELELKKFEQLKATGELPSPKGVALSILRLTQKDDFSNSELERAIKSDPAFVGRLLKTANMAGRNGGRPVVAIGDALTVLGISVVRSLALGFSLVSNYRSGVCKNFDYADYWARALLTGLALQAAVRRGNWANPEEAFCCGLLAGIGRLGLVTLYPREYSKLLGELQTPGDAAELRRKEQEAFALHHDDLTAALLTDWGFPRFLVETLYFRHLPEQHSFAAGSRGEKLLAAAHLAERVVDVCLAPVEARAPLLGDLLQRAVALHLEPEALEALIDGVARDWLEWSAMLQLDKAPTVPSFAEMAKSAAPVAVRVDAGAVPPPLKCLRRVLVADDEVGERQTVCEMLCRLGYEVFEAVDGQQALEMALKVQPQVLIADCALSELNGVQLTQALRGTKLGRGMVILILAAMDCEDRLVEAFEAGADDYLARPVRERVLAARLQAGERVLELQQEVARDHEEMQQFAAELAVSNRRLHEAAVTDVLTGFRNRRYAMDRLEKEWSASLRSQRPLSCMMIDIDSFKQINDCYGHDIGDRVLLELSQVLKNNLRANDEICRIGGDEFLVISPDTDAVSARLVAERMRSAAEKLMVDTPRGLLRCGISIGVASRSANTLSTAMLIKAADEGMYAAKSSGRNRVGERLD